jgi:hypothetical protein
MYSGLDRGESSRAAYEHLYNNITNCSQGYKLTVSSVSYSEKNNLCLFAKGDLYY